MGGGREGRREGAAQAEPPCAAPHRGRGLPRPAPGAAAAGSRGARPPAGTVRGGHPRFGFLKIIIAFIITIVINASGGLLSQPQELRGGPAALSPPQPQSLLGLGSITQLIVSPTVSPHPPAPQIQVEDESTAWCKGRQGMGMPS